MNNINFRLRNELIKEIPELLKCFQCGTCVSSCLAERYGKAYSPRKKILAALYGEKQILDKELWRCLTCNNCNERCPQEVNPYDVLVKLKKLNAEFNYFLNYSIGSEDLHFHIRINPRFAIWAGFEWSTDMIINSVSPEDAAKFYRG